MSCVALSSLQARTISNPTKNPYQQALIRLNPEKPLHPGVHAVTATRNGEEIPAQVEQTEEGGWIWVAVDLAPGEQAEYQATAKKGLSSGSLVIREGNSLILKNDLLRLRVPASWKPGSPLPAPIQAYQPKGAEWSGAATWLQHPEATGLTTTVDGGPLFAQVTLRYEFGDHWAECKIRLPPGKPYAWIQSRHSMRPGDGWRLELCDNQSEAQGLLRRWYSGPFKGAPAQESFDLTPGFTRLGDTVVHLQPRWTQSYDEAWSYGVSNGPIYSGALVLRAGLWRWPHDNTPAARVREGGGWTALDLPTWRGARSWLLLAGDAALADQVPAIARRENVLNADKLTNQYRLPFAGDQKKWIGGVDFFSNQTNPTGMMRQQNRRRLKDSLGGKTTNSLHALYEAQAFFDPDWYGYMEHGWSPINPNFHTDFIKGGIALTAQLRNHPEFPYLRDLAEEALRRDIDYAITLPGGAGQECPGYQRHAMKIWNSMAPLCAKHLGFDPRKWPRYVEGARFQARVSPPEGSGRKFHPAGDTHPGGGNPLDWAKSFGVNEDPKSWSSEELPGFGAVLRQRPGTNTETFVSFKAGPNRGHFHGDQLSIHWVTFGRSLAVDHHASYKPRPGQEHMHNRLSFTAGDFEFANMDGHERLIAFKRNNLGDVAVGEVSSGRLRKVKKLPPEDWDVEFPQIVLDEELRYRRTLILLKGSPELLVMLDEFSGPELSATWNLHVTGNQAKREGDWINFGVAQAFVPAEAGESYEAFPWEHENGGLERTVAGRITRKGTQGQFLSVLLPGNQRLDMSWKDGVLDLGERGKLHIAQDGSVQLRVDGKSEWLLQAQDIDLNRSQGEVGLFIPDVGYPFGPVPQWLIDQRADTLLKQ